jgi:hypothetical protein
MLLLVDNCEHVVDAAAVLIDDILSRCPGITVLATSREALAIPDEVQVTVGPLGTPPGHTAPGQVLSYPGGTAVRRTSSRGAPRVGVRRAEPDRDRRDHPVPRRHPARGRAGCGPGDVVVAVHQGVAVAGLGRCHEAAGDLSAAQDRYQEALDLGRRLGEPSVTASALEGLGTRSSVRGRPGYRDRTMGRSGRHPRTVPPSPAAARTRHPPRAC